MATLSIKVIANARGSSIAGWLNDTLKIRVTAPAQHGQANAAVIALLAKRLPCAKQAITIITGRCATRKTLAVAGWAEPSLRRRLADLMAEDG